MRARYQAGKIFVVIFLGSWRAALAVSFGPAAKIERHLRFEMADFRQARAWGETTSWEENAVGGRCMGEEIPLTARRGRRKRGGT
jgi:hypothetical protein